MRLGEIIRQLREWSGLTQDELGARLGITGSAVCQIEKRGTVNPKIDVLASILYELKAPPTWAFKEAGLPAYSDNSGMCTPRMIEVCEIVNSLPKGSGREQLESLLVETARAWRDYTTEGD